MLVHFCPHQSSPSLKTLKPYKTMPLSFSAILPYKSSIRRSILSLTTRFFVTSTPHLTTSPEKPTVAFYDDLVKAAGRQRDFDTLRNLLNKRVKDFCFNTTKTFNFISNTATSLSVLDDLVQTLARLNPGHPRKTAFESLINRLCKLDREDEALRVVDVMTGERYELTVSSFYPILKCLARKKDTEGAWRVVDLMKSHGLPPNMTAYNYLLKSLCYAEDFMAATQLMKRITEEEGLEADSRTYDALVLGGCRAGKVEGALVLLRKMEEDSVPIMYATFTHVVNGLVEMGYYDQALKFVLIYGGRKEERDKVIFGVLAHKLIKLKRFKEAKLVVEEIEDRGLVMDEKLKEFYDQNVETILNDDSD